MSPAAQRIMTLALDRQAFVGVLWKGRRSSLPFAPGCPREFALALRGPWGSLSFRASFLDEHFEEGLGEHVNDLRTPASQVGEALVISLWLVWRIHGPKTSLFAAEQSSEVEATLPPLTTSASLF